MDPFDLVAVRRAVSAVIIVRTVGDRHGLTGTPDPVAKVYAPFEVACLDLQARSIGRPVHTLIGATTRAWRPPTEEDALQLAEELMSDSDGWQEITSSK